MVRVKWFIEMVRNSKEVLRMVSSKVKDVWLLRMGQLLKGYGYMAIFK